jgi:hypothetical protein
VILASLQSSQSRALCRVGGGTPPDPDALGGRKKLKDNAQVESSPSQTEAPSAEIFRMALSRQN